MIQDELDFNLKLLNDLENLETIAAIEVNEEGLLSYSDFLNLYRLIKKY
jgi:hypothetical protein